MTGNAWSIDGNIGAAKIGSSEISFDASNPSSGLTFSWDGNVVCKKLFAILLNDEPVEMFVRLSDLVVRLPHRNSDLVAYELCFRVGEDGREIDMLLSAQTNLLDSKPEIKVSTSFPAGTVTAKTDGKSELAQVADAADFESNNVVDYFLQRPTALPQHSLMLLSHPSDFHRAAAASGDSSVSFWVFPEALEKGVIRRARLKLRVLDRATDESAANEIANSFRSEAPPLAT